VERLPRGGLSLIGIGIPDRQSENGFVLSSDVPKALQTSSRRIPSERGEAHRLPVQVSRETKSCSRSLLASSPRYPKTATTSFEKTTRSALNAKRADRHYRSGADAPALPSSTSSASPYRTGAVPQGPRNVTNAPMSPSGDRGYSDA
jgi:hypothetical protein